MAKPEVVRSLNYELIEGASDGSVKKEFMNRSVVQHNVTGESRSTLYNGLNGYGIEEAGAAALKPLKGVVRGC